MLRDIASSLRRGRLLRRHALRPVQMNLFLLLICLLEDNSIDFVNINLELFGTLLDLCFSLFFCVLLGFLITLAFNFDFIALLVLSFQLLFIVFIFVESEEVLYRLPLADGGWQVSEAITKEY